MKVAIISNLYPPYTRGGAEIIAETMAQEFRSRGDVVVVITTEPVGSFRSLRPSIEDHKCIRIYRFFPLNIYGYFNAQGKSRIARAVWHVLDLFNLHAAFRTVEILAKERPDFVVGHNLMGLGFLLPRFIILKGYRYIQVLHDVQLYNPSGIIRIGHENGWAQRWYRLLGYPILMRFLFKKVPIVIAPSRFLLDFYDTRGFFRHARKCVIRNPIALQQGGPRVPGSGVLRVLYIGHLSEAKGAVGLARAIAEAPDVRVHLTMIGEGTGIEEIKRLAVRSSGRISVEGRVPHSSLPKYLADTDVSVAPSLCYDAFPTVIAEALWCGVPVISFASGGASEIIRDGENGWILPPGDWRSLIELLGRLSVDRDRLIEAASHASHSVQTLTANTYIDEILKEARM